MTCDAVVLDDACLRCSRPFASGETTSVVKGGPSAKFHDIAVVVCAACVHPSDRDVLVAQTVYFPGPGPRTWPRYVGTVGCEGFLKVSRLENGVYRLGLHRGHAEVWSAGDVERLGPMAHTGVYSPAYELYGSPDVIPNGIRQAEVRFLDCRTPEPFERSEPPPRGEGQHVQRPVDRMPPPLDSSTLGRPLPPSEYSRALEEQLALCRWFDTADAAALSVEMFAKIADPFTPEADTQLRQLAATMRRATVIGDPYYWSPPMCRLLTDMAGTVPDAWMPAETSFPTADGFAWFATPLQLPSWPGGPGPVRSITWSHDLERTHELLVCVVVHCDDPRRPAGLPTHYVQWPRGVRLGEILRHQQIKAENVERAGAKLRHLAAMFALLEQRIIVPVPQRASRAVRRRMACSAPARPHDPVIRVVTLRRTVSHEVRDGTTMSEWSCQWVVRGHWRMQWCPAAGTHRPMWILPHIKGPEDKPLKSPAATLFAVVR
jgi:hypothetical protein